MHHSSSAMTELSLLLISCYTTFLLELGFKAGLFSESVESYPERNCCSNLQGKYSSSCNDNKSFVNLHIMESMTDSAWNPACDTQVLHWQAAQAPPQTHRHWQMCLFSSYRRSQPAVLFAGLSSIWIFSYSFLGFQRNLFCLSLKKIHFCLCLMLRIMTNWIFKN